ncbi:MAG: phosphate ABC transporter permease subunit PstC [Planctomycetes bacterium]|nr:phosphate ABC transporter permease subunit PstC [Planctomycetota bacterium]
MKEPQRDELQLSRRAEIGNWIKKTLGRGFLLLVTVISAAGILFILAFMFKDAFPFFREVGPFGFFHNDVWDPTAEGARRSFGALGIFLSTGLVTFGACLVCVPMGISAAVCLSDVVPFGVRQVVKPIIELLAAIPSVAYGFFALIVFAPLLQNAGGPILSVVLWVVSAPTALLGSMVLSEVISAFFSENAAKFIRPVLFIVMFVACLCVIYFAGSWLYNLKIEQGANALNASLFLALMALPTVVSVCEDALTAVGREIREGSYALGATRAETMIKVVIPAAKGGILAAILLGVMRAVGETMVVVMAAGKATQIPKPWYNLLSPVRPITATIAIEMGEVARDTTHYHALFALAFILLLFSFACNLMSEWSVRRTRKKLGG